MFILEVLAICSSASAVCTATYKFYAAIKSNKYAANSMRIYELNQHERGKFNEIVIPKRTATDGHTHGESAAARSAGSSAASAYAYSVNRTPFYLSMSASDQRADRQGERTMHWSKDFNAEARRAEPVADSMLVLIDVDEHIDDLDVKLHNYFLPTILYTFQPAQASATCIDYRYTFNKDNTVEYDVTGGGHYQHAVWDYSPDCLTMRKKFLGITYAKSFFTVEKRYVDEHHQLVLLTPLVKFGILGCMLSYNVSGNDLKRLQPVQGEFARLAVSRSRVDGSQYHHQMSTSRLGMYNCATITLEQDNALALASQNSESKLSPFQVKSMIPGISNESATTLVDYHRQKKAGDPVRVVVPTDAVNNYTYNPVFTLEEKPSVVPFMAPLLSDAYAPTQSVENDGAMVKGRITGLKTPPKSMDSRDVRGQFDPMLEKELLYANEFSKLLRDETGLCVPVGHEEIVEKLNRPAQRRITDEAAFASRVEADIKSFMKKEAYQKPTDPRPIATINGKDKYEYSSFTYAVSMAIKKTSWYAFGRKPREISERVAEVCMNATHAILTDLSRFDGRVNLSLRQLEEIVMKALFEEKHWKQMLHLMRRQYGAKGITRLGVKYKNGFNRQSGSPETAIFNSICNAFMAYVTFREAGCEPKEAYRKLGVYGGDDGLTPDVDAELYTKVAAKFGHVLEADKIERGKKGISFLARLYSPNVWYGDTSSCADISRALSKFHTTVACNVKPEDKLFEKAYALYLTDADTPIIGDFVCHVVDVSGKGHDDFKNVLNIWGAEIPLSDQYPNVNVENWMDEVIVDQGLSGFRIKDFVAWLSDCKVMSDFLKCPAFIDKPDMKLAKVPIKINDDLFPTQDEMDALIAEYLQKKENGKGDAPTNKTQIQTDANKHSSTGTRTNTLPVPMAGTAELDHAVKPTKLGGSDGIGPTNANVSRSGQRGKFARGTTGVRPSGPKQLNKPSVGKSRRARREYSVNGRRYRLAHPSSTSSPTNTHDVGNDAGRDVPILTEDSNITSVKPTPGVDLTTQGIEPNPGPSTSSWNYPGSWFDRLLASKEVRAQFEANDKKELERKAKAVPELPLVGIETNPGPVTLPIKGSSTTKPKTRGKKKEQQVSRQIRNSVVKSPMLTQPLVAAPVAMTRARYTGKPRFKRTTADSMTIYHSELVSLVVGSNPFATTTLSIQPGLSSTFRWLSFQTQGWEKYRFKMLRAWYETRTGTSIPGTVMLVADYDAADPAPTSQFDASTYHGSTDDAPWKEQCMEFDMKRSKELYLRGGPLAANLDIKTYDYANLFICTTDGSAVNWGKVYLEYEIELLNTQVLQNVGTIGGTISAGGTTSGANVFGTAPVVTPGSYIAGVTGTGVISLQNLTIGAEYQAIVGVVGVAVTDISDIASIGLSVKTTIENNLVNAGGTRMVDFLTFTANLNTATITISATATSTNNQSYFTFSPLSAVSPF